MIHYIKYAFLTLILFIVGYSGYNLYVYFFDMNNPEVSIVGMQDWCSGVVKAKLCGRDSYKIAHVSAWIDGKPLFEKEKVGAAQFERELIIQTTDLVDGKHTLRCKVVDGTKNSNHSEIEVAFFVDNIDLQAALLNTQNQKILQGRCLKIKFKTNKPVKRAIVKTMSSEFICFPEYENSTIYEAFVPVACEQELGDFSFTIDVQDYIENTIVLQGDFSVLKAPFKQKVINVKAGRLKDESQYTNLTDRDLEEKMLEIANNSPAKKIWKGLFEIPLHMTGISTEFGLIRTSQERGRYAHKAVDLVGMPRSVVWASNDGIVVLKDRYIHTGNTIVIDHGHGIVTLYCHFEEYANIEVGQLIKKGKPIGTMGMTGYANGYHLHWELRVNNVLVDPMEWTK